MSNRVKVFRVGFVTSELGEGDRAQRLILFSVDPGNDTRFVDFGFDVREGPDMVISLLKTLSVEGDQVAVELLEYLHALPFSAVDQRWAV